MQYSKAIAQQLRSNNWLLCHVIEPHIAWHILTR